MSSVCSDPALRFLSNFHSRKLLTQLTGDDNDEDQLVDPRRWLRAVLLPNPDPDYLEGLPPTGGRRWRRMGVRPCSSSFGPGRRWRFGPTRPILLLWGRVVPTAPAELPNAKW